LLVVDLQKKWHSFQLNVTFKIPPGKVTVLFGPSGAGKSSILHFVSGLATADNGSIRNGNDIWFDKKNNINLSPQYRSVGYVFQDYALFPHLTVEKNVLYGAKERHSGDKAKELLAIVGLSGYERYYPSQLSGGQKQRIALIRALAREPDLLLMDEPLSAVDWHTRRQLQDDLKRILHQLNVTTLYVTHDIPETYKMADNVVVIHSGNAIKQGTPEEVFLGKRLSTRVQLAGKVIDIEYDTIMAIVTILHAEQYFKTLIDTEEVQRLNLKIGDDVIIGAKSSDVVLFKAL